MNRYRVWMISMVDLRCQCKLFFCWIVKSCVKGGVKFVAANWNIFAQRTCERERKREREDEGEKDNKKPHLCQCKHAFACQSIPLWLIWKGWFLARRTLEALTRLLLHSSASHNASVCSKLAMDQKLLVGSQQNQWTQQGGHCVCAKNPKSRPGARYREATK